MGSNRAFAANALSQLRLRRCWKSGRKTAVLCAGRQWQQGAGTNALKVQSSAHAEISTVYACCEDVLASGCSRRAPMRAQR